jgi:histidinol-phosphate aminotransferase
VTRPLAAPLIAAIPATVPFVAPEELARRVGRAALLRLGANESAFGPSPRALAAMREAVAETAWYGDPESRDLREALARRYGVGVEHLVVGSGIDDLLGLVVRGYCAPGDVAVMTAGSYATFAFHVAAYGVRLAVAQPSADGGADPAALVDAARIHHAKIVYLANPDNPSDTFVSAPVVARIRAELPSETLFVLDEAYADFVPPGELPPDGVIPGAIRMRTFSKAHGLAGARIAYAIAEPETIALFQKFRLHFGVNRAAQAAALAALADDAFVAGVAAEVAHGREDYRALGARLGLRVQASHTNFVLFEIGTRAQAEAVVAALLERGVFVRKPGAPPLDGWIRVTVGTPSDRRAFAEAFAEALAEVCENRLV